MKSRLFFLLAWAVIAAGCATRGRVPEVPAPVSGGTIVRYNPRANYVVAECSALPSPHEEANVIRANQLVGRIRFTGEFRPPYAIADVVAGEALAGDRWQREMRMDPRPMEQQP